MKYEVYVPSTYSGKVTGAETAVSRYHERIFGDKPMELKVVSRKFPSGAGTPRPEQPFSIGNLDNVVSAAHERVAQIEEALREDGVTSTADNQRLVVAQESGLRLDLKRVGVYDHTVAVVKDLESEDTATGISEGVRFPTRDVVRTVFRRGGFRDNTVGDTFARRMAKEGEVVNRQDPYPAMGHASRDTFILQATEKAMQQLPPRRS